MTNSEFVLARLRDVVQQWPVRAGRLGAHLLWRRYYREVQYQVPRRFHIFVLWWVECLLLILEWFGIGECYDILTCAIKGRSTRPLDAGEYKLAAGFFGPLPVLRKVRVDDRARMGTGRWATAYVSCYTINSRGRPVDAVLIHELVHVIQYHQYGLRYITRALYGQFWGHGYDYGGVGGLERRISQPGHRHFFNPEQEAELVTDLFLLSRRRTCGYFGKTLPETISHREVLRMLDLA